jgi:hypothetical protein
MPYRRISGKGGLRARLSFSPSSWTNRLTPLLPAFAWTAFAALGFCPSVSASENILQSILGADHARRLWMPCEPRPADTSHAKLSATLAWDYLDLIRKTGPLAYDYAEAVSSLDVGAILSPGLETHLGLARSRRELGMRDSASGVDNGGRAWDWRATVTYRLTPWIVPSLSVGGDSHDPGVSSLSAFRLAGGVGSWLDWSLGVGRKSLSHPASLTVPDYAPIPLPVEVRQDFREAGLRLRSRGWDAAWTGRWTRAHYPGVRPRGYSLGDSGTSRSDSVALAFSRSGDGKGIRRGFSASLTGEFAQGRHTFRGINRKGDGASLFSYQETLDKLYLLRADLRARRGAWEWGAFAGGGETEFDAVRPQTAFNHHFWERNGALDSYQGGLLGVFSDETWLFNGAAYAAQASGGAWSARSWEGWRAGLGLGYHYLRLESNSHLTQRQSTLLLAYKEKSFDKTYPRIDASILAPELRLDKSWGRITVSASAAQALPIRVEIAGGGTGTTRPAQAGGFSGGTQARLELGWRLH